MPSLLVSPSGDYQRPQEFGICLPVLQDGCTELSFDSEANSSVWNRRFGTGDFDQNLPKISLQGNAQIKVQEAIKKFTLQSQSDNIFVDISTSKDRATECAVSVTTCIRPSHPIFSVRLSRFVTTEEMFRCQGLWKEDFKVPQAISDVLADPRECLR